MTTEPEIRILLLDTETNGLPKNRYAPITTGGNWPAILQLSWAEYAVQGSTMRTIVKRDIGLTLAASEAWDTGAARIHGITEMEARRGTAPAAALQELAAALRRVQVVVAHNLSFDKPVIRAAAHAAWASGAGAADILRNIWPEGLHEFCTMEATRDLLRIPLPSAPTSGRWKAPRLNELYTWLYGHVYDMSGAVLHTAQSDTHCLERCVAGLLRKGRIVIRGGRIVASPSLAAAATADVATATTGLPSSPSPSPSLPVH
jgi:DNA polymerase-3 subunit alpha